MNRQSIFRELRDIPNTDGFKLIGITKDKQFVHVTVTRGADGCHTLGEGVFSTLAEWMTVADFNATVKPVVDAVAKQIDRETVAAFEVQMQQASGKLF